MIGVSNYMDHVVSNQSAVFHVASQLLLFSCVNQPGNAERKSATVILKYNGDS